LNNVIQLAGFALVAGFSWWVWEPLPLLVVGVLLVVAAEVRQGRTRQAAAARAGKPAPPTGFERGLRALTAAVAAFRSGDRR
jgi:hypothetical protein